MKRLRYLGLAAIAALALTAMIGAASASAAPTTGEATGLTPTTADLHATVDTGGEATLWGFEFGTTTAYERATVIKATGSGLGMVAVSAEASGLKSNTTYHYRLYQDNEGHPPATSEDKTFTTPRFHKPLFESESYPFWVQGYGSLANPLALTINGMKFTCAQVSATGVGEPSAATATASFTVEYESCSSTIAGIQKYATIKMNSCHYNVNLLNSGPTYAGSADVVCTKEGDGIAVNLFNSKTKEESQLCGFKIGAQTGRQSVSLQDIGEGTEREVSLNFALTGVSYSSSIHSALCGWEETGTAAYNEGFEILNGHGHGVYVSGKATKGLFLAGAKSEEKAKQPRFESESYPATIVGAQSPTNVLSVTINGLKYTCSSVNLDGEAVGSSATVSLAAEYNACSSSVTGLQKLATIKMNSCHYNVNLLNAGPPYTGSADVACTKEGDAIVISLFNSKTKEESQLCGYRITPQSGRESIGLETTGTGIERGVNLSFALKSVSVTTTVGAGGALCGPEKGTATYGGAAALGAF